MDPFTGHFISHWPFVGLTVIVSAFFLYAASGLLVPWYLWFPLMFVWLVLFPPTLREWGEKPMRPLQLGLAALAVWAVVVVGGGVLFAWDPWWPALTNG